MPSSPRAAVAAIVLFPRCQSEALVTHSSGSNCVAGWSGTMTVSDRPLAQPPSHRFPLDFSPTKCHTTARKDGMGVRQGFCQPGWRRNGGKETKCTQCEMMMISIHGTAVAARRPAHSRSCPSGTERGDAPLRHGRLCRPPPPWHHLRFAKPRLPARESNPAVFRLLPTHEMPLSSTRSRTGTRGYPLSTIIHQPSASLPTVRVEGLIEATHTRPNQANLSQIKPNQANPSGARSHAQRARRVATAVASNQAQSRLHKPIQAHKFFRVALRLGTRGSQLSTINSLPLLQR